MIPSQLFSHLRIEDISLLVEDEQDMLLYICNVIFPIKPPTPTPEDTHPITLNIIRYVVKESIIERVKQAQPKIKEESMDVFNRLKVKLGIV